MSYNTNTKHMAQNTALQELIERLRIITNDLPSGSNRALGLATAMDLAYELKSKERNIIEQAHYNGQAFAISKDEINGQFAKDYFTDTFNSK